MGQWEPMEDTPFADANAILTFSVTGGWATDREESGEVPDDEVRQGDPIIGVGLGCLTPEDREKEVEVTHPEQLQYSKFMMHTRPLADLVASLIVASMQIDPLFMNRVINAMVSQEVARFQTQVESMTRPAIVPESGD